MHVCSYTVQFAFVVILMCPYKINVKMDHCNIIIVLYFNNKRYIHQATISIYKSVLFWITPCLP